MSRYEIEEAVKLAKVIAKDMSKKETDILLAIELRKLNIYLRGGKDEN